MVGAAAAAAQASGAMEVRQLLPVIRVATAATAVATGSHTSDEPGNWLLVFDNSYSILRSKTVFYRIVCGKAAPAAAAVRRPRQRPGCRPFRPALTAASFGFFRAWFIVTAGQ